MTAVAVLDHAASSVGPLPLAAAARGHYELVFVVDETCPEERLRVLRAVGTVVDGTDHDPTVAALRALDVAGVVPFCDARLSAAADLAADLGLPGHRRDQVPALVDKLVQRTALRAAGLPTPRFAVVTDPGSVREALAAVGLPAVVKPRRSAGSRDTGRLSDPATAYATVVDLLPAAGPDGLIVEEELRGDPRIAGPGWGDYVSVETACTPGRRVHLGVTGKPPLAPPYRETGTVFPSTLDAAARREVCAATDRALDALGIEHGMTHTEWKLTAEGPRLIEVNGRLGGYVDYVYRRSTGRSLARTALALAVGDADDAELTAPLPTAVAAQLFTLPPADAAVVLDVVVDPDVRGLPGLERLDVAARPGQPVDWRRGTAGRLSVAHTRTADHASTLELWAALAAHLHFQYGSTAGATAPPATTPLLVGGAR